MDAELRVDDSDFLSFREVTSWLVAGRALTGPGAAFLSTICLFFLGIWAHSSHQRR